MKAWKPVDQGETTRAPKFPIESFDRLFQSPPAVGPRIVQWPAENVDHSRGAPWFPVDREIHRQSRAVSDHCTVLFGKHDRPPICSGRELPGPFVQRTFDAEGLFKGKIDSTFVAFRKRPADWGGGCHQCPQVQTSIQRHFPAVRFAARTGHLRSRQNSTSGGGNLSCQRHPRAGMR